MISVDEPVIAIFEVQATPMFVVLVAGTPRARSMQDH